MKVIIDGEAKEIAALVLAVQGQRESSELPIDEISKAAIKAINQRVSDSGKQVLLI